MIKELEDYTWFPPLLRRFQMDFIGFMVTRLRIYAPAIPFVKQFIKQNAVTTIQDTCSGSGAPAVYLHHAIQFAGTTVLTDKFPDATFSPWAGITYVTHSVDVLKMVPEPGICYTMYNALHHFSNDQKKQLVLQLQEKNAPFLFAEILQPGFIEVLKILFTTTILQLFVAPFIQPFSLRRLFFTYIIPVNIFTITYDGLVSVCKSATEKRYCSLFLEMSTANYSIQVTRLKSWKSNMVLITGNPIRQ